MEEYNKLLKKATIITFITLAIEFVSLLIAIINGNTIGIISRAIILIISISALIICANIFNPVKKMLREYEQKTKKYVEMTLEELQELDDHELTEAVYFRLLDKTDVKEYDVRHSELNDSEKVAYVIKSFDDEIQNGGLCQFFVNSSRCSAPYISDYFNIIGADKYKEIYNSFININNIDTTNLSEFDSENEEDFLKQYEKYDFETFDDKYGDLCESHPIDNYLAKYIRSNIQKFA